MTLLVPAGHHVQLAFHPVGATVELRGCVGNMVVCSLAVWSKDPEKHASMLTEHARDLNFWLEELAQ